MEQDILREILDRLIKLETKLDNYNGYRQKTDEAYNKACSNEKDIKEIKSNMTWLWRTIAGALILGGIATFIQWR